MTRLTRRLVLALALALPLIARPAMAEAPLRVGTSAGPYAEILDYAAKLAKAQGLDVTVIEFTDYTIPNEAMARGDLDASNFQNVPYMTNANRTRGYDIVAIAPSIVVPLGVYSKRVTSIAALPDGAQIAIPNDPANEGRALLLLSQHGLITLQPGIGLAATVLDIAANPKHFQFRELDAAQLPRALDDVAAGAVNLNYAIPAGIDPKSALIREDKDTPYGLVWTTLAKDRNNARVLKLIAIYRSPEVRKFILDRFGGTIIPTW